MIEMRVSCRTSLRSQDFLMLTVPKDRMEMGKRTPLWNMLQNNLKLKELIPHTAFKYKMNKMEAGSQKL